MDALREILNFREIHKDNTVRVVVDDILCPTYEPGDYVGGRRCYDQTIPQAVNNNCIVETKTGLICIGFLKKGSRQDQYTLIPSKDTPEKDHIIEDTELTWATPITWHLKHAG